MGIANGEGHQLVLADLPGFQRPRELALDCGVALREHRIRGARHPLTAGGQLETVRTTVGRVRHPPREPPACRNEAGLERRKSQDRRGKAPCGRGSRAAQPVFQHRRL